MAIGVEAAYVQALRISVLDSITANIHNRALRLRLRLRSARNNIFFILVFLNLLL